MSSNFVNKQTGELVQVAGSVDQTARAAAATNAEAIEAVNARIPTTASQIAYSNSSSNLTSTNVNDAISELGATIDSLPTPIIPKGTVAFENLPALADAQIGWMYNISTDFRTTDDFINSGILEKSGSNVYVANVGTEQSPIKKWDVFAIPTVDVVTANLLNACWPVGSIYWSSNPTDPSILFGGTWTRIKDTFVYAAGDNDIVNNTNFTKEYGNKTVRLVTDNLPDHHHAGVATQTGGAINIDNTSAKSLNGSFWITRDAVNGINYGSPGITVTSGPFSLDTTVSGGAYGSYAGSGASGYPYKFTGAHRHTVTSKAGKIKNTSDGNITQTAVDKMPPTMYRYCWERTA